MKRIEDFNASIGAIRELMGDDSTLIAAHLVDILNLATENIGEIDTHAKTISGKDEQIAKLIGANQELLSRMPLYGTPQVNEPAQQKPPEEDYSIDKLLGKLGEK